MGKISEKRMAGARDLGTIVAYRLFMKFLNPKNRGETFTWVGMRAYVLDMVMAQVSAALPESCPVGIVKSLVDIAQKHAGKAFDEAMRDSGLSGP